MSSPLKRLVSLTPPHPNGTNYTVVVGTGPTYTHWLMKAEPDSRLEKGKDVKVRR